MVDQPVEGLPVGRELPDLSKSWWNKKWWLPWSEGELVIVRAQQVKLSEGSYAGGMDCARAKIRISRIRMNQSVGEARNVHDAEAPWPMPIGNEMLLLQVYLLSQMPGYPERGWQPAMEKFCRLFPNFQPPSQMYWSKPGEDGFEW